MILSNASPLIYLAKLGKLELLKELFRKIIIPREVYDEVVAKGKEGKFFDALKVEKAIKDGWIDVKGIKIEKEIEGLAPEIDKGETALLSLAKREKAHLILIDDACARTIAESLGFNAKGTLYVLLKAYRKRLINKNEVKESINKLVLSGFRLSQELYIAIMKDISN